MKIDIETPPAWPPARRRPPECLSDLFLERLQHGELRGEAGATGRKHLEGCQACRDRAAAVAASPADGGGPPPLDLDGILGAARPGRRSWRRLAAAAGASAAALSAVLWLASGSREMPSEQVKGPPSLRLQVIRQRDGGGGAEPVAPGGAVRPGDRLRFAITAADDGFAAVVSLDARGVVTAFYPAAGEAVAVQRGRPHLSSHAVALDDTLGRERLILVGCPRALPVAEVAGAARRALASAGGRVQAIDRLDLACDQTTFWLSKVAR
jgi:hypothetical protein